MSSSILMKQSERQGHVFRGLQQVVFQCVHMPDLRMPWVSVQLRCFSALG